MYIRREKGPLGVRLPDGSLLLRSELPSPSTKRWVGRRKAAVVAAVDHGLIDAEEAQRRYDLSADELDAWRAAVRQHGPVALRATALQRYRTRQPSGIGEARAL